MVVVVVALVVVVEVVVVDQTLMLDWRDLMGVVAWVGLVLGSLA